MMILPLADALQNSLQNLTSRIAGVDNEQMTNRVIGMGTIAGFGLAAIKKQFKTPSTSAVNNGNSNSDNSGGGLKGFVSRAKSVINPTINLSDEKDYNGNINPIRNVLQKQTINTQKEAIKSNSNNDKNTSYENKLAQKSIVKNVVKTGFNATKTYLGVGARMAEGNFSKSAYKGSRNNRKDILHNTEYVSKLASEKIESQKAGDDNEFKGKN